MWYVIWATTGEEELTKVKIERCIDHNLYKRISIPYVKKFEKRGNTKTQKEKRMFPSYLFVETDHIEEFSQALISIPGFAVILHGDGYQPLHRREENMLLHLIVDEDIIDISVGYIEGDNIVVTYGPLVGMEGSIKRIDRHKRLALVEMDMFDRVTELKVGLEIIEKK